MSNHASFLPDDYLAQRHERRTNLVSLVLFAVVMLLVFLAFVFTNQRWAQVKRDQAAINARYMTAADAIKDLTELQEQRKEMLQKADLAAALVERVPRSILLAELINRMPQRLSLLEFEMESKQVKSLQRNAKDASKDGGRLAPKKAATKEEAMMGQKILPPRYDVEITLVGVAPSDLEVSRYITELNVFPLLRDVNLIYSEEQDIDAQTMRKFAIELRLDPAADVRSIDPRPRLERERNPMSTRVELGGAPTGPGARTPGAPAPTNPKRQGD